MLVFILGLHLTAVQGQSIKQPLAREQTRFTAEDESVERPVAVPETVVEILRQTVRRFPDETPPGLLLASEIHLDGPNETDLIVIGVGVGLREAHSVPFWVFRKTSSGYTLVLSTGGDGLRVTSSRWKSFRNIEAYNISMATAKLYRTTYRFDGKSYQKLRVTALPIG
jgi:hypothetical protein